MTGAALAARHRLSGSGVVAAVATRFGHDGSGATVLRRRRFALFLRLVDQVLRQRDTCRILDLGGESSYWRGMADMIGARALRITLLNLAPPAVDDPGFAFLTGDARRLGGLADLSFDLVHSNSVIEHVGGWNDMLAMATEARRLAPGYYVQTPYFWFPVEPHCSTAFFHWLPPSLRVSMLMRKPRGNWGMARDVATAIRQVESATLLDRRMMAALFPDGLIHCERFAGLVKSLIAIRSAGQPAGWAGDTA